MRLRPGGRGRLSKLRPGGGQREQVCWACELVRGHIKAVTETNVLFALAWVRNAHHVSHMCDVRSI